MWRILITERQNPVKMDVMIQSSTRMERNFANMLLMNMIRRWGVKGCIVPSCGSTVQIQAPAEL